MSRNLGRNDLCWCGSGIKYKRCHLDRKKQESSSIWEAEKELWRAFSTKECLAPEPMKAECSNTIVNAHTVPKSGSLQKIARNGHIYSFAPRLADEGPNIVKPQLKGINKASTFTGFCSVHDNMIFSKIERELFVGSQEQCFLIAYRALVREVFMKKGLISSLDISRKADRGKSFEQQMVIQAFINGINTGAHLGLRDLEYYKGKYDNMLVDGDFRPVRAYIIELNSPPPIMCSSGVFPEEDFKGKRLQNIANHDVAAQLLSFASFYGGSCGVIVFSWLSECDPVCQPFIDSLKALPPDRMTDGIIRFFFEFCENLHIQPDWWEGLSDKKRDALVGRLNESGKPWVGRESGCLVEDNVRFDNWTISNAKAILH